MARTKLDLGGESVRLEAPIHARGRSWELEPRAVRYYPEIGETVADAESFASAIAESYRAMHARRVAELAEPAVGYDASRVPADAPDRAARLADLAAAVPARGAGLSAAVRAIHGDTAPQYYGGRSLAESFAAFLARDRAESRASVQRLAARIRAERAAAAAAAAADAADAELARVARELATSGPTAAAVRAAGGTVDAAPYAIGPAEPIAETAETGTPEDRAAAFIADHPMHDYSAVLETIRRADAYQAPGGSAGSLAPLTLQSRAGTHAPERCAAARDRDDIGGWHAGWGLCRDMAAAAAAGAEPIADVAPAPAETVATAARSCPVHGRDAAAACDLCGATAAGPAPARRTVVDYSRPMPAGFVAADPFGAIAGPSAEPVPVSAERIAEIRSAGAGAPTEYARLAAIVGEAMREPAPEPAPETARRDDSGAPDPNGTAVAHDFGDPCACGACADPGAEPPAPETAPVDGPARYRVTAYASWSARDAGTVAETHLYATRGEAFAERDAMPYPIVDVLAEPAPRCVDCAERPAEIGAERCDACRDAAVMAPTFSAETAAAIADGTAIMGPNGAYHAPAEPEPTRTAGPLLIELAPAPAEPVAEPIAETIAEPWQPSPAYVAEYVYGGPDAEAPVTANVGVRRYGRRWRAYDLESGGNIGPEHRTRREAVAYAAERQATTYTAGPSSAYPVDGPEPVQVRVDGVTVATTRRLELAPAPEPAPEPIAAPAPAPFARMVRRGPADAAAEMVSGDGWILPRADAIAAGLLAPSAYLEPATADCARCGRIIRWHAGAEYVGWAHVGEGLEAHPAAPAGWPAPETAAAPAETFACGSGERCNVAPYLAAELAVQPNALPLGAHASADAAERCRAAAAPILAAVPAPEPSSSRPTCPRCGQTFRRSGTGYAWHVANRPDCAAARLSAVA